MLTRKHVGVAALGALIGLGVLLAFVAVAASNEASAPEGVRAAPWAFQPQASPTLDDVPLQGSVVFPPGVDYQEGLQQLYVSVVEDNRLPDGAALAAPLPREVVLVAPAEPSAGVRLSLTAPWGWTLEERQIRPPSFSLPGSLSPAEVEELIKAASARGAALPAGATIDVPDLPACQKALGNVNRRPSCQ